MSMGPPVPPVERFGSCTCQTNHLSSYRCTMMWFSLGSSRICWKWFIFVGRDRFGVYLFWIHPSNVVASQSFVQYFRSGYRSLSHQYFNLDTLPQSNIAPKNEPSQDVCSSSNPSILRGYILLMEEILHHLGWLKSYK